MDSAMADLSSAPRVTLSGGYVLAGAGALLFSLKGILVKLAYGDGGAPDVDAITLIALRMAFSLPFYVIIGALGLKARAARGEPPFSKGLLAKAALVGLLGYYLSSYLDFAGLQYLSAQFERLILMTYPVFVALLGAAFFGARLTKVSLAALAISYSGIVFIFAKGATAKGDNVLLGAALVFAGSFTYALYNLLARPLVAKMGASIFTSIATLAACAGVLLHFMAERSLFDLAAVPKRAVMLAAVMAITSTVLPSFMLTAALNRVGPQAVSMIGTISPVSTIILAMVVLGEPFTLADAIGTALVIAGIAIFTYYDVRRRFLT
jgi:drug/metabolite transporter (DMT)-like permease